MSRVCWVDLGVSDVEAGAAFYSELFGWTVAEPDDTGYRLASLNGRLVAALGPADDPGPPYWTVYLHTADITASMQAVVAAGGTVITPPAAAGDAGVGAVVRDPHGGPLSFWQPGNHSGTDDSGEHGTFAGVHVQTDGTFLRAVAGWQLQPGGTVMLDGQPVATWIPGTVANPWLVYFHVTNVADTVAKARQLGASEQEPGIIVDPAGARFGLREPRWGETT
jgi:predicted enzyme related to lactoylglutathione lyase